MNNNVRLDINVREAPISKISIYKDHIDIITGKKKENVLRRFDITSKVFLNKYTSLPDYINKMFDKEIDNTYFFLEGLNVNVGDYIYTPTDKDYDRFTFDDYFDKTKTSFKTDMEYEIVDYISDRFCIMLSSNTYNFYKQYKLTIAEGDYSASIASYINGNGYFKEDDDNKEMPMPNFLKMKESEESNDKIIPIRFKGLKARLSVIFAKEDAVYYSDDNNINYGNINKMKKIESLLSNNSEEKLVSYNNDMIITKKE